MFLNTFFRYFASVGLSLSLLAPCITSAQLNLPPVASDIERSVEAVAKHAVVIKAFESIKANSVRMWEEQIRLNEIPAPPFKEQVRAEYYVKKMREFGLADAYIDKE